MKRSFFLTMFVCVIMLSLLLSACGSSEEEKFCNHERHFGEEQKCEDVVYEYLCEVCGEIISETVKGLGHDFEVDFTVDKEPTEHEDGQKSRHCMNCDATTDVTVLEKTNGFIFELNSAISSESSEQDYYVLMKYDGTATQVYIPSTYKDLPVKEIQTGAFENNQTIEGVIIPDSVQFVAWKAFGNCTALISVDLPDSVVLDSEVFSGCTALEQITLPINLEEIDNNLFEGCTALKSITIPESVKRVGWDAFKDCTSLKTVVIPDTVETIHAPFDGCTSLEEITIPFVGLNKNDGHNLHYSLFDQNDTPASLKKITVTGGDVPTSAFSCMELLTTVILEKDVTSIDSQAFLNCTSLNTVEIRAAQVTVTDRAFWGCTSLETLIMPMTENTLSGMFESTAVVPLKKVVITGGTVVTDSFFSGCDLLTEAVLPETITALEDYAFFSCDMLQNVNFPKSLTAIGDHAFAYCAALKEITLPETAIEIGESAFWRSGLTSVSIPAGTIGDYAFSECEALTYLHTGSGVIDIGVGAFSLSGLTTVELSEGLKNLRDSAFLYCRDLTELTLPNSVTRVGKELLVGCEKLTSLTVPYLGQTRGITPSNAGSSGLLSYYFNSACTNLTTVTITMGNLLQRNAGDEWIAIDYNAFKGNDSVQTINLPENLQYIGDSAFEGCNNIKSITIPGSVFYIGNYAFSGTGISSIRLPSGVYQGLDVANIKNGYNVIGLDVFNYCPNLTEIIFSTAPTIVNAEAFANNSSLTSVTVPNNVELKVGVFYNCNNIEEISLPGIVNSNFGVLFTSASEYNDSHKYVDMIEQGEFNKNLPEKLKTVYITGDNDYLLSYTFSNCTNIESIYCTGNIGSIQNYAFKGCSALKTIVLPQSTVEIRDYAFAGCTALESLSFGSGMKSVGDVFADTKNLKHVYFNGTQEQWDDITFWYEEDYLKYAKIHFIGE